MVDGRPSIRVAIAGRRPDVRRALQIRLALETDVTVVGSTSSVQAALPVLRGIRPDVLLVDADMTVEPLEEALRGARQAVPGLRVVLLTHDRNGMPGVTGADDVVHKGPDAGPLLAALRGGAPDRPAASQGFV